jgi:ABC-type transport system substrate-binding protein
VKLLILNQAAYQNMALVARALLADVGITVEVDSQEGGTYWNSGKGDVGKNIDMFIVRFNGKHDPNFIMQWFVSKQIGEWNWQRWNSPEFDALFAQSAGELDAAKRRQEVVDAQRPHGQERRLRLAHQRGQHTRLPQLDEAGGSPGLDRLAIRRLRRHELTPRAPARPAAC